MIIGRRDDFIAKIRISCAAWRREDTTLAITTQGHSFFVTAFHEFMKLTEGPDSGYYQQIEDYEDEVLVEFFEAIERRDYALKRGILAYYEKHNPRAKATAERQLKMEI